MTIPRAVHTDAAPAAIGPYSQAVRAGDLVFCSGQIPLDPDSGKLVEGDMGEQTRQVIKNLDAVLRAAGASLSGVVKSTVFLIDLGDFAVVNEAYAEAFGESRPARATVQVSALPMGCRVEIEAIAVVEQG